MAFVFSYGTLRPTLYPGVVARFSLIPIGAATLRGPFQMLHLGGFPGLIHNYALPCHTIYGEVVEVETLDQCDRYEGYKPGREGNLYDRKEVAVKMTDGSTMQVWVYLFNVDPSMHDPINPAGAKHKVVVSGDWARR